LIDSVKVLCPTRHKQVISWTLFQTSLLASTEEAKHITNDTITTK